MRQGEDLLPRAHADCLAFEPMGERNSIARGVGRRSERRTDRRLERSREDRFESVERTARSQVGAYPTRSRPQGKSVKPAHTIVRFS
jgi:hypothetical protein